jgi:glycosyltransferase involved in cell wall biosynthesis
MEVRDLWPQTFLDMGLWKEGQLQVHFFRKLEQFLYQRAERIVTLSPQTRDYLAKYSESWADKTAYIPNGTLVERFGKGEAEESHGPRPIHVMYLGAMGVTNGLDKLLEAVKMINDVDPGLVQCILVGDGPEKPRLQALAHDLRLDNVDFGDPVPRADVPRYTAKADILILIQNEVLYGSSNKLYDYMAAAKPIVFALVAGHNNLAEDVGCGVSASPEDVADLAEKLFQVARMPRDERKVMGERGRAYVRRYHDYSVLARRLAGVFEALDDHAW